MQLQIVLAPGVAQEFQEEADFFRVLDSAVTDLDVIFYKAGAEISRAENITAGYGENFRRGTFDKIRIESATGGAVSLVTRLGNEVSYDKPPTGNVSIVGVASVNVVSNDADKVSVFNHQQATLTNIGASSVVAAKADRKYLLIQNKDAIANIWIRFGVAAASQANGVKIGPGGSYELAGVVSTQAISMITDVASTSNLIVVEG